jgi:tetratricopeptide (TPR) repeat protein
MRRVNKRLFLFLILGVATLTGGLFLLHYIQSGRVEAALLRQAARAEEEQRPEKVVQYLSRYLDFEPDDLEERVHLAKTLAAESPTPIPKARERAIYNLESVLTRDPDRVELRCLLARLLIELRRWDPAREQLALLERVDVPKGEYEYLLARFEEGQEHYEKAEALYARRIDCAPDEVDSYARRAYLLRARLKDAAKADRVIDQMVEANPNNYKVHLQRWTYRLDFGLVKKDTVPRYGADVDEALRLAPDDADTLMAAAEREWRAERADTARPFLKRGLEAFPTDPRFYVSMAELEVDAHEYTAAEEALRKGVEAVPASSRFVVLWKLANLLVDENEQASMNEAELARLQAEFDRIMKKLAAANPPLGSADYLQGRLRLARGNPTEAVQFLERARPLLVSPSQLVAQLNLQLAQCYEQLPNVDMQRQAYERILKLAVDPSTGALLKEALAAKIGLARLAIAQNLNGGRGNEVELLANLISPDLAKSDAPEVALLAAELLVATRKNDDARRLLEESAVKHPDKVDFPIALAALTAGQGNVDEARQLLDQTERKFGDKADLRLARMQFLGSVDATGADEILAKLASGLDRFTPADQARLLRGLAETYQALGRVKESKEYWLRLADHPRHRTDSRVRLLLLDQAMQAGDDQGVRDALEQIHKTEGDHGTLWLYADAVRRVWLKKRGRPANLDETNALLDRVLTERPDWPAALLAKAEVEDLRGNHAQAADLYRRSFAGSRRNPLILTQLMASSGRKPEEIEQNMLHAVELAPAIPEPWIAYIQFLAIRDRSRAEAALEKAKESLKKLPSEQLSLALAPCYEALGQRDRAKAEYEAALTAKGDTIGVVRAAAAFYMRSGDVASARKLFQKIIDGKVNATAEDIAWARSGYALTLVVADNFRDLAQAAKFVGLQLDANGDLVDDPGAAKDNSTEGILARARLLSMQTRKQARSKAVALLEDLNRRHALGPDDKFLLAQLYDGQGEKSWPEARKLFAELAESDSGNGPYLTHFIYRLIAKGEMNEAQRLFTRLEAVDPGSPQGAVNLNRLVLQAEILEATGKGDEAVELLKANARRKDARPEEILLTVRSLGRQKRVKEALDLCEEAWKSCPPEEVGGASVALLRLGPIDDNLCDRVQERLLNAIKKEPNRAVLRVHLADLYDFRRLYRQAETQYRLVLEKDPNNLMALNNLAWLLAQRSGNGEEAKTLIDRALDIGGPRPELLDTRAVVNLALKESGKAIADLQRALAESPSGIQYFHLARAHEQAKDPKAAAAALEQAKKLGLKRQNLHPIEVAASGKLADELDRP